MKPQLRDTQFALLIRLVSKDKFFQYPDEIDPSLSAVFASKAAIATTGQSRIRNSSEDCCNAPEEEKRNEITPQGSSPTDREKNDIGIRLVGWYGADDEENPQNWSSWWKGIVAFQICMLNFAIYIASSIYVPGEPSIEEDFGVSTIVATLGLSLYTIGYGIGPMLWSPLSEVPRIGRRSIYFWTLIIFLLLQLPTGFAINMPMFLVFRILTGFFGSPALATGGGTVADMYDPAGSAYGICILGFFGVCGPVFGPIVGGFLAPAKGWRWTIWAVSWLGAGVLVMLFFFLPETSGPNILYRRAKRLRERTGDHRLKSRSEVEAADYTTRDHLLVLGRAFTLIVSEPIVFSLDLYTALLYGVLFTWFESFPLVFGDIYGFTSGQQGLVFLGILTSGLITVPLFFLWVKYGLIPRLTKPDFKPETILIPTFFGSAALPICLFWYGWSAQKSVPWIVPVIGSSFFTVAIITLFFPVLNYLGVAYPANVASIFAGNALFRATFGATFPLFARQLFRKLGIGPGNSLLGGIAVCFMVLPLVFYKYGERIRGMSKNASHSA